MARTGEGKKDPALNRSVERGGAGGSESGVWLAFFTLPSALHGDIGKRATSVGLRAPAGRFDAAKGGSIDTGGGRRAVSSSPGRGPLYTPRSRFALVNVLYQTLLFCFLEFCLDLALHACPHALP